MKKIFKNKKAITLISLVVTIVILVILAAVAINMAIGNNGLFNKAKLAKSEYTNAADKERKDIDVLTNDIDVSTGSVGNTRGQIMVDETEYEGLKTAVAGLNSKQATIDITTPNEQNAWVKVADYPVGFDYNNCMYKSGYVIYVSQYKYAVPATDHTSWSIMVRTSSSGIEMYLRNCLSFFGNVNGKIVLEKI